MAVSVAVRAQDRSARRGKRHPHRGPIAHAPSPGACSHRSACLLGSLCRSGLVRFVRVCSGCSGRSVGCALSGRGGFAWSALVRFVRVCSGCSGRSVGCALSGRGGFAWSGLFGVSRGLCLIWSGRFDLARFGRVWSGCVAAAKWAEMSIGRSPVLFWRSDGITTWGGMGRPAVAVDSSAATVIPFVAARHPLRRPRLDLGPKPNAVRSTEVPSRPPTPVRGRQRRLPLGPVHTSPSCPRRPHRHTRATLTPSYPRLPRVSRHGQHRCPASLPVGRTERSTPASPPASCAVSGSTSAGARRAGVG